MKKYTIRTLLRSIVHETHDLVVNIHITEEMKAEAIRLAARSVKISKEKNVPSKFDANIETPESGYLGQFLFHEWLLGDWRKALSYIESELEQMENKGTIEGKDGEIDGRSVDVKTGDLRGKYLVRNPVTFGLLVSEIQARRKIYDLYVYVILNSTDMIKLCEHEATIYGFAFGDEVEKTEPMFYENWRTKNRMIHFNDLHPIRFLKSDVEDARGMRLKDVMSKKTQEKTRHYTEQLFRMAIKRSRAG